MPREEIEQRNVLTFDENGATRTIKAPKKGLVEAIIVSIVYTVTDAGISAGETMGGLVSQFRLGKSNHPLISLGRNDLTRVAKAFNAGSNTGRYQDDVPTTATEEDAFWHLPVGMPIRGERDRELTLNVLPAAQEFGGASAMTGAVHIKWIYSERRMPKGLQPRIVARHSSSDTIHEISLDGGFLGVAYLEAGTAGVLTEIGVGAYAIDRPYQLHEALAAFKNTARTAKGSEVDYLSQPNQTVGKGQLLNIEASSATTIDAVFVYAEAI